MNKKNIPTNDKSIHIGMILDAPFPPDIRVEREVKSLHNAGFKVFVLSQHWASLPEEESTEYCHIVRFNPKQFKNLNQLTRDFKKITFFDPVWRKGIDHFVRKYRINYLHVHDLPLVKTAYAVAKKYGIPLTADYHENFPAHVQAVTERKLTGKEKFYRSYKRWEKYEESISRKVDAIIVVAKEYRQHLIEKHKIPPEKIVIVQNTIDTDIFSFPPNSTGAEGTDAGFVISYFGSYGPHRGLDTVIRAMPEILSQIPAAEFIIIGRGKNKDELVQLVEQLQLKESIKFFDWVNYSELVKAYRRSNVGVIPHRASEHTDSTIPNKLFEYMYFGVPVLVSDRPPLKRIVEETGAGRVFKTGDPGDLAQAVLEIFRNPDKYGEMGIKAVKEKYNWKVDGEKLVNLYRSFASIS